MMYGALGITIIFLLTIIKDLNKDLDDKQLELNKANSRLEYINGKRNS